MVRFGMGTLGMLMIAFGLGILWRPVQTIGFLAVCFGGLLTFGYGVWTAVVGRLRAKVSPWKPETARSTSTLRMP